MERFEQLFNGHFHSFFGSRVINMFIGEFSTGRDLKTEVFVQAGFMESCIVDHLKVSII